LALALALVLVRLDVDLGVGLDIGLEIDLRGCLGVGLGCLSLALLSYPVFSRPILVHVTSCSSPCLVLS
jgi:hypothetical protein